MNMDRSPVQAVPTAAECTASSGNDQEYRLPTPCDTCGGPRWGNRLLTGGIDLNNYPATCPSCSPFGA